MLFFYAVEPCLAMPCFSLLHSFSVYSIVLLTLHSLYPIPCFPWTVEKSYHGSEWSRQGSRQQTKKNSRQTCPRPKGVAFLTINSFLFSGPMSIKPWENLRSNTRIEMYEICSVLSIVNDFRSALAIRINTNFIVHPFFFPIHLHPQSSSSALSFSLSHSLSSRPSPLLHPPRSPSLYPQPKPFSSLRRVL